MIFFKEPSNQLQFKEDLDHKFVTSQFNFADYDTFDDYLEIILEFGYLVLFAECFPYAAIFIVIFLYFEMRNDIFKLATSFKKPFPLRKRNIGSWNLLMKIMSVMGVFTNTLLYLNSIDPKSHDDHILSYVVSKENFSTSRWQIFFVVEHVVLILFVLLNIAYKDKPYWVRLFHQRREHKQKANGWLSLLEGIEVNN